MKNLGVKIAATAIFAVAVASISSMSLRAQGDDRPVRLSANLSTFHEVPPKGTGGSGTFHATLSADGTMLSWTFTWEGLTGPPAQAHIHFGQRGVNASVMTFFCGGPKPACPQTTSGSITGMTTAADILPLNTPPSDQGLNANDFATFLRALRSGDGYCNMHTARFPGGEIRGQIVVHHGERDDDE